MTTPTNTKMNYLTLAAQVTTILSLLLAAYSLHLTKLTIRNGNTIEADKSSSQLLLAYYDMKGETKQTRRDLSITEPMSTEIASWKTLFIAESIFLNMKASERPEKWLTTIDFLIRDATGLEMDDEVIATFDQQFGERMKKIFADGKNNKGEAATKFATKPKGATP
jgi:hypothetical protein